LKANARTPNLIIIEKSLFLKTTVHTRAPFLAGFQSHQQLVGKPRLSDTDFGFDVSWTRNGPPYELASNKRLRNQAQLFYQRGLGYSSNTVV